MEEGFAVGGVGEVGDFFEDLGHDWIRILLHVEIDLKKLLIVEGYNFVELLMVLC